MRSPDGEGSRTAGLPIAPDASPRAGIVLASIARSLLTATAVSKQASLGLSARAAAATVALMAVNGMVVARPGRGSEAPSAMAHRASGCPTTCASCVGLNDVTARRPRRVSTPTAGLRSGRPGSVRAAEADVRRLIALVGVCFVRLAVALRPSDARPLPRLGKLRITQVACVAKRTSLVSLCRSLAQEPRAQVAAICLVR